MGNRLSSLSLILIITWAIGFFVASVGAIIHILMVIAIVSLLLNIIQASELTK